MGAAHLGEVAPQQGVQSGQQMHLAPFAALAVAYRDAAAVGRAGLGLPHPNPADRAADRLLCDPAAAEPDTRRGPQGDARTLPKRLPGPAGVSAWRTGGGMIFLWHGCR